MNTLPILYILLARPSASPPPPASAPAAQTKRHSSNPAPRCSAPEQDRRRNPCLHRLAQRRYLQPQGLRHKPARRHTLARNAAAHQQLPLMRQRHAFLYLRQLQPQPARGTLISSSAYSLTSTCFSSRVLTFTRRSRSNSASSSRFRASASCALASAPDAPLPFPRAPQLPLPVAQPLARLAVPQRKDAYAVF